MCLSKNNAFLSEAYLRSQLTGLWRGADHCAEETQGNYLDMAEPDYEQCKAARAFAQYYFFGNCVPSSIQSPSDLFFYASFDEPSLQFVCNHNVILTLTLNTASLEVDFGKADRDDASAKP